MTSGPDADRSAWMRTLQVFSNGHRPAALMSRELHAYYERELIFIRQLAQEFARQYPAAAGRLLLEPNRSVDPHVERLIEAFALIAGRVQHKLDDEFPELTAALFSVLYPHYLAPVPSTALVQFDLDYDRTPLPNGFLIGRGSRLHTAPVSDTSCRYRTAYDVTLWPVALTSARFLAPPFPPGLDPPPGTAAALRLRLECRSGLTFAEVTLDRLRLHLSGEGQTVATLYEFLFNNVTAAAYRPAGGGEPVRLEPPECLAPVGFGRDEGLLPYPERSFLGYRLLTEYFAFPAKFLFADLTGLGRVRDPRFGRALEVVLYMNRTAVALEQGVSAETFRLGCTPVVNLFEQTAEPIPVTHARHEYRVVPDVASPLGMEVYSVDSVVGVDPVSRASTEYDTFYSFRHGASRDERRAFWCASRRPGLRDGDRGTDVFLSLVDLNFDPASPAEPTLVVRTTCTNRDLPARLRQLGDRLTFTLEAAAPLARIRCLRLPTAPLRPPTRRGAYWRLLSHLNLNHLSLTDPAEGREALKELLRLYDFTDPDAGDAAADVNRQIIEGVTDVSARRAVNWIDSPEASGFCRGVEVTVEFDETNYVGTGVFLFASVLERFLGLYVSINSFSQFVARLKSGKGVLKRWPPRAGEHRVL
jgi:type VI secretion system protein ImpG